MTCTRLIRSPCLAGKLLRTLVKLCFVAERPDLNFDPQWYDHSDRYLLRLYRDSLFHQVDENGAAVVDFARVVSGLNKLDVGSDGKTLLSGQSDGSLLLVSHKDVKHVLERSFDEVVASQAVGVGVV